MITNLKKNIFYLSHVYRPVLLPVPALIFGLGMYFSQASFSPLVVLQLILITFLAPILVFGVNDVFDYESDFINPRKNSSLVKLLPKNIHKTVIWLSIAVSFTLLLSSLITQNILNIFAMCVAVSISWLYSTPPFQLKNIPFGDVLSNVLGLFSIAVLGVSFGSLKTFLYEVPAERIIGLALSLTMASLLAGLADFEADSFKKINTTAVYLGKFYTVLCGFFCIVPLLFLNFQEASFMKAGLVLLLLIYSPLLFLFNKPVVVRLVYLLITLITIFFFSWYFVNLVLA